MSTPVIPDTTQLEDILNVEDITPACMARMGTPKRSGFLWWSRVTLAPLSEPCPECAQWWFTIRCCGTLIYECDKHFQQLLTGIGIMKFRCVKCNKAFHPPRSAIVSSGRI